MRGVAMIALVIGLVPAAACSKKNDEPSAGKATTTWAAGVVDKPAYTFTLPAGKWLEAPVEGGFEYANRDGTTRIGVRVVQIPRSAGDPRLRVRGIVDARLGAVMAAEGDAGAHASEPTYEETDGVLRGRFHGADPSNSVFFSFLVMSAKQNVISVSYTEQQRGAGGEAQAEARAQAVLATFGPK